MEELKKRGQANGVPGRDSWQDEVCKLEPGLHDSACAALLPYGGCHYLYEMAIGFAENAAVNGVSFMFDVAVTAIREAMNIWW